MQRTTPISQETDASLLAMMAKRKQDKGLAFAAWEEFHTRHIRYVYVFCRRAFQRVRDFESIVEETMERALKGAGTFDPAGLTDRGALEALTRRWLKQIARNVFLASMEKEEKIPVAFRDPVVIPDREARLPDQTQDAKCMDVRAALESLNHQQKEVILTWLQFGDPNDPHSHLADEVITEVCRKLKIKPATFRQIKKRALTKMGTMLGHLRCEAMADESKTTAK